MTGEKTPLRSEAWFKRIDNTGYEHRTHLKARGALPDMFDGKPVIGYRQSGGAALGQNVVLKLDDTVYEIAE